MVETYIAATLPYKVRRRAFAWACFAVCAVGACQRTAERLATPRVTVAPLGPALHATHIARGETFTVIAAGDIAGAANEHEATAALVVRALHRGRLAAILPLGDLQYPHGDLRDFRTHYAGSWGVPELFAITHPVPGNHEYERGNADGYFDYWNGEGVWSGRAGARDGGYYSYEIGDWHFIALNSSDGCQSVPCAKGSPMHRFLVEDLRANETTGRCVLAYWHHPRFHNGAYHVDERLVAPLWDALVAAGADVVLNGHEHDFQQLAPLDEAGRVDPVRGVRSFVVGTGGAGLYRGFRRDVRGVREVVSDGDHGVLELALGPGRYVFTFRAVDGSADGRVLTQGTGSCHARKVEPAP